MANATPTFRIDGARLIYKNFSGAETRFKPEGNRSFHVVLDKATADQMAADGWNVKCKPAGVPSEEGDDDVAEEFCHIEVAVGYKFKPPKIVAITGEHGENRTMLTEETVGSLDWAEMRNVDLIARGFEWGVNGKSGIKAYLQTMFVTIEEDELERKYALPPQEMG